MEGSREDGIVIFDEVSMARLRADNLFKGLKMKVYSVSNEVALFNLLLGEELNIRLIIMDIGYDTNKGFEILSKIKEKRHDVPVVILTSNNKRQTFVRGIAEGATDYILKPFEDDYLVEKVSEILSKKTQENAIQIEYNNKFVFDISSYLTTELKKAEKGKYEITILMITFFIPVDEVNTHVEKKYIQVSDLFYQKFNSILWETDVLEKYGSQTFIGMFPYCGFDNVDKIKKRFKDSFDELKEENAVIKPFSLAVSAITYPSESKDAKEVLLLLGEHMKKEIEEMKQLAGRD